MINQAKLLDGFIYQIVSAKNALFDELNDKYEGLPVNELNTHITGRNIKPYKTH